MKYIPRSFALTLPYQATVRADDMAAAEAWRALANRLAAILRRDIGADELDRILDGRYMPADLMHTHAARPLLRRLAALRAAMAAQPQSDYGTR